MNRNSNLFLPVLFLMILWVGCYRTSQIRSESQVTNISFEIKGLSKSISEGLSIKGMLKTDGEITIASVGDIIPHQNVIKSAAMHNILRDGVSINNSGYDFLYEKVKENLKADITIANYESPIAPISGQSGKPFVFNSDKNFLLAARDANINVFNIANNHIYDQDLKGFEETLEIFKLEKSNYIGTYIEDRAVPLVIEKNGIKVAIFGFTTLMNNMPNYNLLKEFVRKYDGINDPKYVKEAKSKYDIVIVYIHWGQEYAKEPDRVQREIAEQLVNAGADIIIGGHPHVLQPLELFVSDDKRVVPVAFSMGNFISNQSRNYHYPISGADHGRTRDSAILKFKIIKYSFQDLNFCVISDLHFIPLWTHNNNNFYIKGIDKKLDIYVLPINERLNELKSKIETENDEKIKKEMLFEFENLIYRLNIIRSVLGEDFVKQ